MIGVLRVKMLGGLWEFEGVMASKDSVHDDLREMLIEVIEVMYSLASACELVIFVSRVSRHNFLTFGSIVRWCVDNVNHPRD